MKLRIPMFIATIVVGDLLYLALKDSEVIWLKSIVFFIPILVLNLLFEKLGTNERQVHPVVGAAVIIIAILLDLMISYAVG